MDPQLVQFLSQFVSFSSKELEQIAVFFKFRKVKKGHLLVENGAVANELCFVKKGIFRIFYSIEGKEFTRFFAEEGIFVSALPSFVTRQPSMEIVQALENAELLALSYQDLQQIFEISPKWERVVRIVMEQTYVRQQQRIYSLIADPAQVRLERLRIEKPSLFQRVPQYMIANYLGISPETLSRLRKN
jgi:CRP-like cAMP-binding protein